MAITYVSAFIDLQETREEGRTPMSRFHFFEELASTGINIHLFLSYSYRGYYETVLGARENVFVDYIELADLATCADLRGLSYTVPPSENKVKDTANYHIINNAKIEFVERAIKGARFNAYSYAWIDFSIGHMFRQPRDTLAYLKGAAYNEKGLVFPGCWPIHYRANELFTKISWRFCGSFFLGDRDSLLKFAELYRAKFRGIVEKRGVLPWEVNIWHYLELHEGFAPRWFSADHDDSIVRFVG